MLLYGFGIEQMLEITPKKTQYVFLGVQSSLVEEEMPSNINLMHLQDL